MPLTLPGGVELEIVIRSEDTDGRFCLLTDELPAGWALPAHRHANESETIIVLTGRLRMTIDGVERDVGPGDVVHVPSGVSHDGAVVGNGPVTRTVVFSPGGMERFFEVLAAEPERAVGLAVAHGWSFS